MSVLQGRHWIRGFPKLGVLTKISHNSCNYVLKRVSPDRYEQASRIRSELSGSRFVRLHVDENEAESTLIFPYFTEDLLSFLQNFSLPINKIKNLLQASDVLHPLGFAEELTTGGLFADLKSNNILLMYEVSPNGEVDVTRVNVADWDNAAKLKEGQAITGTQVGNVMWRSPEAHAGIRIGKASDIFSFGIIVIHAILRIHIFGFDQLPKGVEPQAEVLHRMISYFGPVPVGLLEHINDDRWCIALIDINRSFNDSNPAKPFSKWKGFPQLDPNTKRFIRRMVELDPAKRATTAELLEDSWWHT
ncbi:MAG: hypothetical protein Q9201_001742 [Fulgogasparrea decipioides]